MFSSPRLCRRLTETARFRSPVLGGEVFAIDRHFFQHVGGFDPGMLLWGEEQIELSIRVGNVVHPSPTQRLIT